MSEINSLINFGDMSKPANTLIEKVSDAVGGVFKPWHMRSIAKAEADVDLIKALSKIEITDLEQRAIQRFMHEEAKKQNNIESITSRSLPQLNESAKPEEIDEDWITNFMDKCRLVSDDEMQSIWARILAGEANEPGKFSKRTVNFMESLNKQDALFFTKLCAFNCILSDIEPFIYDYTDEIYTDNGVYFDTLNHLDTIGLISLTGIGVYQKQELPQTVAVVYDNTTYTLKFPKEKDNILQTGKVMLTNIGRELASICAPETVTGFDEYIIEKWKTKGIEIIKQTSSAESLSNNE